jgi:hypothetical protein
MFEIKILKSLMNTCMVIDNNAVETGRQAPSMKANA